MRTGTRARGAGEDAPSGCVSTWASHFAKLQHAELWAFCIGTRNLLGAASAFVGVWMLHNEHAGSGIVVMVAAAWYLLLSSLGPWDSAICSACDTPVAGASGERSNRASHPSSRLWPKALGADGSVSTLAQSFSRRMGPLSTNCRRVPSPRSGRSRIAQVGYGLMARVA